MSIKTRLTSLGKRVTSQSLLMFNWEQLVFSDVRVVIFSLFRIVNQRLEVSIQSLSATFGLFNQVWKWLWKLQGILSYCTCSWTTAIQSHNSTSKWIQLHSLIQTSWRGDRWKMYQSFHLKLFPFKRSSKSRSNK